MYYLDTKLKRKNSLQQSEKGLLLYERLRLYCRHNSEGYGVSYKTDKCREKNQHETDIINSNNQVLFITILLCEQKTGSKIP